MGSGAGRMSPLGLLVVTAIAVVVLVAFLSAAPQRGLWYGAGALIGYALLTRWLVTADHRVALWHLMNHDYEEAAERFRASFEWFSRHPWIDRARFFLLLSPTGYRYREMGLLGCAYALAQLGRPEARDWYLACTRDYPKNMTAVAALELIRLGARLGPGGDPQRAPRRDLAA